ncbi:MAG: DUF1566 domain-containing protein [Alphaproteobacteria bacterium]|nr:DUF1566 domain-containing protein [Alphaproteobacteria bacterium]
MRKFVLFLAILVLPCIAKADCAGPPGKTAEIIYNVDYKVMQYCNGTDWIAMGGGSGALPACSEGDTLVYTSGAWTCNGETPPASDCTAQNMTWLTNCAATVSAAADGGNGTASITDPGGCGTAYYGTATYSCANGTFSYASGTCTQQTACDTTPNVFHFTDLTDVELSTLTTSTAVTILGINTATSVSVTGGGSPNIRIGSSGSWVTSGTITNGQTLEVRLTSSNSGDTTLSATVTVGGVSDQWDVTTKEVCDTIGQVCADGSIFAGDTNMYVTDIDQNHSANWNAAVTLCNNLDYLGHTDWYLPSKDELSILYSNKSSIGGFTTGAYWSATPYNGTYAWYQSFNNGAQGYVGKIVNNDVRCVRRG